MSGCIRPGVIEVILQSMSERPTRPCKIACNKLDFTDGALCYVPGMASVEV